MSHAAKPWPQSLKWLSLLKSRSAAAVLAIGLVFAGAVPDMRAWAALPAESVTPSRLEEILAGDEPRTIAELKAMQDHVQKLVAEVMPCVVAIDMGMSQGSGVVVTRDGYVLTAGHVISQGSRNARIYFQEGKRAPAKALGINSGIDSGLVKISQDEVSWPYVEIGDSDELKPGQWVLTVGHPGGYEEERGAVVRLGRILSISDRELRTDCVLVGGDSGGPLFDMQGRVIGINSRIGDELEKNIHVPVNTYGQTWDRLAASERWGSVSQLFRPAYIGLSVDKESDEAVVTQVATGGPADQAGIRTGDVILSFNEVEIEDYRALLNVVVQTPANESVTVVVRRGDEEIAMRLTTAER